MIKTIAIILAVAGGVYVGMNWETISGKVDEGTEMVEDIKDRADDIKEDAGDAISEIMDKVN